MRKTFWELQRGSCPYSNTPY